MVTDATGDASVTGTGKPVKIVFSYACFSDLSGDYNVTTLRDGAPITPYSSTTITETGVGEYRTTKVGHWDDLGVGTPGFTFYDVCDVLTVPTQDLVEYYSNVVHGDESPDGEVKEDGTLVITYKITSSWESEYESTYTPAK
jgi:hypothetical protein